ncbi:MAG TPA: 50S ribosomal protein L3 [Methanomicrobia archaeon]|nr:50S ribosomal protein L3 [Methanomicrobia archaeon]
MAKRHRPRRGSLAYSPRKRARSETCRIKREERAVGKKLQGFAGYKAGMTHLILTDDYAHSLTKGMEIAVPATIIETPPMRVVGFRLYKMTAYGRRAVKEVWIEGGAASATGEAFSALEAPLKKAADTRVFSLRLVAATRPEVVAALPKKKRELMEIKMSDKVENDLVYAKELIGKDLKITDVVKEGDFVDVTAITRGKGTQGPVKRWGVMIQNAKAQRSGRGRHVGAIGGWRPRRVRWRVPQMGQTGYHQRTEYNKRVMKIGVSAEEITPKGGFVRYGTVSNEYLVLKGSVPGPKKRLIRISHAIRPHPRLGVPELITISTRSQQG